MKETQPKVFIVAKPSVDWTSLRAYLDLLGASDWATRREKIGGSEAEILTEVAGRLCYKSWQPGLNPNVSRIRIDPRIFLRNILASGHGSVLEHSVYSFIFHDVSRTFTHELVRHRVGVAISQESLRYVRPRELGFRVPAGLEAIQEDIVGLVESIESFHRKAVVDLGLDSEGVSFQEKKELTSALRRILPMGLSTAIMWSANVRTLRHVIEMRTAQGAEEEIRTVFGQVGHILKKECPLLFEDYEENEQGEWVTEFRKV